MTVMTKVMKSFVAAAAAATPIHALKVEGKGSSIKKKGAAFAAAGALVICPTAVLGDDQNDWRWCAIGDLKDNPGMDIWCNQNCNLDLVQGLRNCPQNMCVDCRTLVDNNPCDEFINADGDIVVEGIPPEGFLNSQGVFSCGVEDLNNLSLINVQGLKGVKLPLLKSMKQTRIINSFEIESLNLAALETVEGVFEIKSQRPSQLRLFYVPNLESVGTFDFASQLNIADIDLSSLTSITDNLSIS
eukprot:gene517-148_t